MNLGDDREKLVRGLLTKAARDRLTQVELALPHSQVEVHKKAISHNSQNLWVYKINEEDDNEDIYLRSDMADWLEAHGKKAPVFHDIYGRPEAHYTWGVELRTKNTRGYGQVGGWIKDPTHVRFYFTDATVAMLFKLTWGGV